MTPDNKSDQIGLSIFNNWIKIKWNYDQVSSNEFKYEQEILGSNYIQLLIWIIYNLNKSFI